MAEYKNLIEARKAGDEFYKPIKPCSRGHLSIRKVKGYHCLECRSIDIVYPERRCNERDIAISEGKDTYFTGKSCKHGHTAERFVRNHQCVECSRTMYYDAERKRYQENPLFRQFQQRKQAALKNRIPFTIEFDELEQPEFCPVFGVKLNYVANEKGNRKPNRASIDKVIPELGYVSGNVRIISDQANRLKNNATVEQLKMILKYIEENTNV
jgi:hypothetical protein